MLNLSQCNENATYIFGGLLLFCYLCSVEMTKSTYK